MKIMLQNVGYLVTMDEKEQIYRGVDVLIDPPIIQSITSHTAGAAPKNCRVIPAHNLAIFPGLINTHHHFYQTFTRAYPAVQNVSLFNWLQTLYPVWSVLNPDDIYYSSLLAIMELLKTGCTTTSDHLYLHPHSFSESPVEIEIRAACETGIRFIATHGSMSRSEKDGGLPPDNLVKSEDEILSTSEYLIDRYHDNRPFPMLQIALAPCSPFSVTPRLMKATSQLARKKEVLLHTHLCETKDEEQYCLETYNKRPLELMKELQWTGEDVWYAHGIHFNDSELNDLAGTGTGICHCPSSNMRLGSGICRVVEMLRKSINVSLGVDGSASNDTSDMWGEVRNALLLQRIGYGPSHFSAYDALRLATKNGARVLKRPELGTITENSAADLIGISLDRPDFIGSGFDPGTAPFFCGISHEVDLSIINGKPIIQDGKFTNIDEEKLYNTIVRQWRTFYEKL